MYPHERSLVKHLAGKPFALIGVNGGDEVETVQKLVEDGTVTWRSFKDELDDGSSISESWEVDGWPTVYIIDAEGTIRYKNPQRSRDGIKALDDAISTLLAEMGEDFPAEDIESTAKEEAEKRSKKAH